METIKQLEKNIIIHNSMLYSFDIFDTLITRTTAQPIGIFMLMQDEIQKNDKFKNIASIIKKSFFDIRIEAERYMRGNNWEVKKEHDVKFEEIYDYIASNYELTPEDIKALMDLEIQKELENFIPINENIEKLKILIDSGNRVILISDMYHSSETIRKFLLKFDEVFKDIKIYVSSEYKEGKHNKKLFEIIKQEENIEFSNWHHYGDNIHADVNIPKELGIKARNLSFEKLIKYENDLLTKYCFSSDVQLIVGSSRNCRFFNKCNNNEIYQLGSSYFTPLLYSFVKHILDDAISKNIEELIFIARDGYILKQIADIIVENKKLPIKTKYFYGSRKAFRIPTEDNYENFIEIAFKEFTDKMSVEFIAERVNLNISDIAKYINITDYQKILSFKERNEIKKQFLIQDGLKQCVLSSNKNRLELLKKYLQQELDFNIKFAFVELSGTGRTQDILQDIIYSFKNYDIMTYYFRIECQANLDKSKKYSYLITSGAFNYIIELFCRNFEGQTLGYKEDGNKIVPILEKVDSSYLENWGYKTYLKAVADYVNYMTNIGNINVSNINFTSIFHFIRDYIVYNSDRYLADLIGSIPFSSIGSEDGACEFSRQYTLNDVFNECLIECPPISSKRTNKKILKLINAKNELGSTRKALFNIKTSSRRKEIKVTLLGKTYEHTIKTKVHKKNVKKVLLISHELTYTGAPHSLLNIAQVLLENNKYVEVYSLQDGDFKKEFEKLGIKVTIKPHGSYDNFITYSKLLKFDLAICNTILAAPAYKFLKDFIPCIWYIREATNIPHFFNIPYAQELISTSKDIYAVSEYAKDFIEDNFNVPVKVVHNCTPDYNNFGNKIFSKDKIQVLVMGTVEYRKRFDLVIDAIKAMSDDYKNKIELKIAGCIRAKREEFMQSIADCPNIEYIGEIKSVDKKIELYKNTDIVVVPSMDESCSRIVLEATMMGIPVIISRNVGAKYMVNNSIGWVVKTGESEPIRQILMEIIDGKYNLEKMSKAAREKYLETSTIDLYNKNILKMIDENGSKLTPKRIKIYLKYLIREIFSVKNTENKKHKVVTILGLKIKIKRKSYE